ncbi:HAD family hydrolase [Xylanibacter muris]|uniref:HAD family hydrolase n=1 Tax=Xylanibacter muris TaxID=2736290 RepID=A0ABX2ANG0_9BACT|nr:HAD family hydrolase [Xylanibacter muris]NPD91782.1 HAD family hydrolase [Xylanibacter muris]
MIKAETIKGLIFDYGGTLDTGGCHWGKVIWHSYERQGVPVSEAVFRDAYVYAERQLGKNPIIQPDYTFKKTLSVKLRIQMEHISEHTSGFVPGEWHGKVLDDIYAATRKQTAVSRHILRQLHDRYPMVLVSNFYGNVSTVLHEFEFDGLFSEIVESAVVGVRKPDPRIFTLGVESLGLNPDETLVIGDSYDKDILPATKAGCRTVWYKGEGWTDEEPDGDCADSIITDLKDLLYTLLKYNCNETD